MIRSDIYTADPTYYSLALPYAEQGYYHETENDETWTSPMNTQSIPVSSEAIKRLQDQNQEKRRNTITSNMADASGKLPADVGTFAHINLNPTTIWSKGSRTLD